MAYRITNADGVPVFSSSDTDISTNLADRHPGVYETYIKVPADFLSPGCRTGSSGGRSRTLCKSARRC